MRPPRSHPPGRIGGPLSECHRARRYLCCRVISHRLVRGITNDTNTHRPRDSHQSHSIHSIASELATHSHHSDHHGHRSLSAVFSAGRVFGFCAIALALLAAFVAHSPLLRSSDANCESMAVKKILDLTTIAPSACWSMLRDWYLFQHCPGHHARRQALATS